MPDFSFWSLQDWGNLGALLAGIAAILGMVVAGVWRLLTTLVTRWQEELADPESLREHQSHFNDFSLRNRYRHVLERALDSADRFFGLPFSLRAYGVCLTIAFFYPVILYLLSWTIGGSHTLGTLEILPEGWSARMRVTLITGLVLYGYASFLIFRYYKEIKERAKRALARMLPGWGLNWRIRFRSMAVGLLAGGVGYAMTGDPTKALTIALFGATVGIVANIGALAGIGIVVLPTVVGGPTGLGFSTGAFTFVGACAGVSFAYGTGASALLIAGMLAIGAAFTLLLSLVATLSGTWTGLFSPNGMSVILFFLLLPLLNTTLDTVSWAISRRLGRKLIDWNFRWGRVVFFVALDILAAVILLSGLAVLLGITGEAIDQLALATVDSPVFGLDSMITQTAADPFGDGLWITFMLLSTIVPTTIHAVVAAGSAFQIWGWKDQRDEWREEVNEKVEKNEGLTSTRTRNKIAWYWALWAWLPPVSIVFVITLLLVWQIPYLPDLIFEAAVWGRSLVS